MPKNPVREMTAIEKLLYLAHAPHPMANELRLMSIPIDGQDHTVLDILREGADALDLDMDLAQMIEEQADEIRTLRRNLDFQKNIAQGYFQKLCERDQHIASLHEALVDQQCQIDHLSGDLLLEETEEETEDPFVHVFPGYRRSGKTTLMREKAIEAMMAGHSVLWITDSLRQADLLALKPIEQDLRDLGMLVAPRPGGLSVEINLDGSTGELTAAAAHDIAHRLRGKKFDTIIVDQACFVAASEGRSALSEVMMLYSGGGEIFFTYDHDQDPFQLRLPQRLVDDAYGGIFGPQMLANPSWVFHDPLPALIS